MDKICRTCLAEDTGMKSVFEKCSLEKDPGDMPLLSEMIMACASVTILENDDLPKHLCSSCESKLSVAYCFKKQCEETDSKLRNRTHLLPLNNIKEEPNIDPVQSVVTFKEEVIQDYYIEENSANTFPNKINDCNDAFNENSANSLGNFPYVTYTDTVTEEGNVTDNSTASSDPFSALEPSPSSYCYCQKCFKVFLKEKDLFEHKCRSLDVGNTPLSNPTEEIPCSKYQNIFPNTQQSSHGSQNIIIETGRHHPDQLNTRHTINVTVNNNKKEHQKRYRERNRDKLKLYAAERRKRIKYLQSIAGLSTSQSSSGSEKTQLSSTQRNERGKGINALQNKRERQRRYRERNRDKLKQREAERRRRLQHAELCTSPNIELTEIINY